MNSLCKNLALTLLLMVVASGAWAKTMTGRFTNPSRLGDYIEYRLPNGPWLQVTSAYGLFKIDVPSNVIVAVRIKNSEDNSTACLKTVAAFQTSDLGVYHR